MKLKDLSNDTEFNLKITDFDNFFDVYEDDSGDYRFNLNETIYLDLGLESIQRLVLDHDMFWTTISYKIYGTTRLAWLLMKINNVSRYELFDIKVAGSVIKYIDKEYVQDIVNMIGEE